MHTCESCKFCHLKPIEVLVKQPKKHWWDISYMTYEMSPDEVDYFCYVSPRGRIETSPSNPECEKYQAREK